MMKIMVVLISGKSIGGNKGIVVKIDGSLWAPIADYFEMFVVNYIET